MEVGLAGGGGAHVDALVGHVDDERERPGPEPESVVEGEVAGAGGDERVRPGERTGHDLIGHLVAQSRLRGGLDRDHARVARERGRVSRVELDVLRPERPDRGRPVKLPAQVVHATARRGAIAAGERLNGEPLATLGPYTGAELVRGGERHHRAHRSVGADQSPDGRQLPGGAAHQVAVLGHVRDHPHARPPQTLEPGVLDRAHELNDRESRPTRRALLRSERRTLTGGVEHAAAEPDLAHVVALVRPGPAQASGVVALGLDEGERRVASNHPRLRARERGGGRPVARNAEEVGAGPGRASLSASAHGDEHENEQRERRRAAAKVASPHGRLHPMRDRPVTPVVRWRRSRRPIPRRWPRRSNNRSAARSPTARRASAHAAAARRSRRSTRSATPECRSPRRASRSPGS